MDDKTTIFRGALLDAWSDYGWKDGVQIDTLRDLDELVVQTENSTYEITTISPHTGEIVVRGGRFFPEFTPARLAGSSLGGSFLKVRGVYVGFSMELHADGKTIVTSRVRSISLPSETKPT
jgi:hypothetical protein